VHIALLPYVPCALGIAPPFLKGVRTREGYNSFNPQPRNILVVLFEIFLKVYPPSLLKIYIPPLLTLYIVYLIRVDRFNPVKTSESSNSRLKGFSVARGQGDPWLIEYYIWLVFRIRNVPFKQ
jgi:hypothetical protein